MNDPMSIYHDEEDDSWEDFDECVNTTIRSDHKNSLPRGTTRQSEAIGVQHMPHFGIKLGPTINQEYQQLKKKDVTYDTAFKNDTPVNAINCSNKEGSGQLDSNRYKAHNSNFSNKAVNNEITGRKPSENSPNSTRDTEGVQGNKKKRFVFRPPTRSSGGNISSGSTTQFSGSKNSPRGFGRAGSVSSSLSTSRQSSPIASITKSSHLASGRQSSHLASSQYSDLSSGKKSSHLTSSRQFKSPVPGINNHNSPSASNPRGMPLFSGKKPPLFTGSTSGVTSSQRESLLTSSPKPVGGGNQPSSGHVGPSGGYSQRSLSGLAADIIPAADKSSSSSSSDLGFSFSQRSLSGFTANPTPANVNQPSHSSNDGSSSGYGQRSLSGLTASVNQSSSGVGSSGGFSQRSLSGFTANPTPANVYQPSHSGNDGSSNGYNQRSLSGLTSSGGDSSSGGCGPKSQPAVSAGLKPAGATTTLFSGSQDQSQLSRPGAAAAVTDPDGMAVAAAGIGSKAILGKTIPILKKRRFPGPAGLLPVLAEGEKIPFADMEVDDSSLEEISTMDEDVDVSCSQVQVSAGGDGSSCEAWQRMLKDLQVDKSDPNNLLAKNNIATVLRKANQKQLVRGKVSVLCAAVKNITAGRDNGFALLQDHTASIHAIIHPKLYRQHSSFLRLSAVLLLKEVTVFSPTPRKHCLLLLPQNVIQIYPAKVQSAKKRKWPSEEPQAASAIAIVTRAGQGTRARRQIEEALRLEEMARAAAKAAPGVEAQLPGSRSTAFPARWQTPPGGRSAGGQNAGGPNRPATALFGTANSATPNQARPNGASGRRDVGGRAGAAINSGSPVWGSASNHVRVKAVYKRSAGAGAASFSPGSGSHGTSPHPADCSSSSSLGTAEKRKAAIATTTPGPTATVGSMSPGPLGGGMTSYGRMNSDRGTTLDGGMSSDRWTTSDGGMTVYGRMPATGAAGVVKESPVSECEELGEDINELLKGVFDELDSW